MSRDLCGADYFYWRGYYDFENNYLVPMKQILVKDRIKEKWIESYSGMTDDGIIRDISLVIPGAIVSGLAVGYFSAKSKEEAKRVWKWKWSNPGTHTPDCKSR